MKTVHELNQEELEELRSNLFYQLLDTELDVFSGIECLEDISMGDVKKHYEHVSFVEEDFFCNIEVD